ncbi:MAG TPA: sporulation protein YunB [Clostridiales bacterium]|jgi:sporulation protein YunB|nr:sporulation protein YunB [Clostridiales bacterium]
MRLKHKRNGHAGKWFISLVLLVVLAVYSVIYTEKIIKPNVAAIAEVRVKAMITMVVNEAVHKQFKSDAALSELLTIKTDQDGNITYVEANTIAMNSLVTELTNMVQQQFRKMDPANLSIPVGSIIGSQILSQFGPYINLKVLPIGTSRFNYKTEFEGMGINQTKYKVFLVVDSQARVLAPFSINNINIGNTILIAEAVIVGEVPDAYINVPPGSAMDATNFFPE